MDVNFHFILVECAECASCQIYFFSVLNNVSFVVKCSFPQIAPSETQNSLALIRIEKSFYPCPGQVKPMC